MRLCQRDFLSQTLAVSRAAFTRSGWVLREYLIDFKDISALCALSALFLVSCLICARKASNKETCVKCGSAEIINSDLHLEPVEYHGTGVIYLC